MARYSWVLASVLFVILEDLSWLCYSLEVNRISLENVSFPNAMIRSHHGSAMVLPLTLSSANSSHSFIKEAHHQRQRQLKGGNAKVSSARMKLYDDLLTNGYYTTRLWIGTPPQEFALIVDSGSTVTYVPCSTCTQCGIHQDPRFQPDLSASYQPVKCGIDCSSCDSEKKQCRYERQYAEMSSSSGVLGEDIVSFGSDSALGPQRAVFGCENSETGDLYHQHADGIMGLGRGRLSIMDQLVQRGVIADSFSLCYGGMDIGGGAMILGAIPPPPDMVFSTSNPNRSPYYNIQLKGIRVAGKSLPLNPQVFDNKFGTVLDSGTTYAYLPEAAFLAFKDAVIKHLGSLRRIPGPDPSYHDICFYGAGSDVLQLSKKFPQVDLVFGNGQMASLAPENYLFRHSKVHGAYCLGIFKNGKDPTTLLGGIVVRNMLVTYDRGNQKIGFWKTNCSELWDRLQAAIPPLPTPPNSHDKNSSDGGHVLPPASAPSNSHDKNSSDGGHVLPPASAPSASNPGYGQEIGRMEMDMSMTLNYKDFKSLLPEFEEDMARELGVTLHQVRIWNFSNEGDTVRIRWVLLPADFTNHITNTTAERIISLLMDHRVHLRDAFGNYHLMSWKILPPSERTWLQQHGLELLGGGVGVTVIASALLIYWYYRRQKQEAFGNYKTVDAVNLDEELQQL
eukprot:Gb_30455 [translate_table: standard]